jgi:hypothetical protein
MALQSMSAVRSINSELVDDQIWRFAYRAITTYTPQVLQHGSSRGVARWQSGRDWLVVSLRRVIVKGGRRVGRRG